MNDLFRPTSYRTTTPTVLAHAHQLTDFDVCWGMFADVRGDALDEPPVTPPPAAVLRQMLDELQRSNAPASIEETAAFAGMVIQSYPQQDNTTGAYARLLANELARVPRDMQGKVFDSVLRQSPDFRPGIGRVKQIVDQQLAKRDILRRRCEAALRYWQHKADQKRAAAERAAAPRPVVGAVPGTSGMFRISLPRHGTSDTLGGADADRPKPKPRHVIDERVAAARARLPAIPQD
jgi:hypothetical protein